jgi:hypothetical protein
MSIGIVAIVQRKTEPVKIKAICSEKALLQRKGFLFRYLSILQ